MQNIGWRWAFYTPAKILLDIKAPSPGDVISEYPPDQRCNDGRNPKDGSHHPDVACALGKRRDGGNENCRARVDAGRPRASDGPADDESDRVRCDAAEEGTKFEKEDGAEIDGLGRVEREDAAPEELGGAARDEISARIPTNVAECFEFIRDARDCCRDDCAVQGDEEHGNHVGEDDDGELQAVGILRLILLLLLIRFGWRTFVRGAGGRPIEHFHLFMIFGHYVVAWRT